jgi:hypothetical protein
MFNADQKYTKESRGPKSIHYLLFTCFLMHSLRKFLSETCMPSLYNYCRFWHKRGNLKKLNFFNFHPILMHFFAVFIFTSYWWTMIFFIYLILKKGSKRVSNSTFCIFLLFFQFWPIFYGFRDKLDRKRPKSANFQNFKGFTFSSKLNVIFAKCSYNLCLLLT